MGFTRRLSVIHSVRLSTLGCKTFLALLAVSFHFVFIDFPLFLSVSLLFYLSMFMSGDLSMFVCVCVRVFVTFASRFRSENVSCRSVCGNVFKLSYLSVCQFVYLSTSIYPPSAG